MLRFVSALSGVRLRGILCAALAGAAALAMAAPAMAAEVPQPQPHPQRDFSTYQPSAKATRIQAGEAPSIDGDLSDPVWQKAQAIDEFYQLDPGTGEPGTEPTVVRFLYDENNLYVSIYAYDSQPDLLVARNKSRDGNLGVDDTVRIYLDPQNTRRNSYYFEMNALGARVDALIQNNSDYIKEWNTIWSGRAMKTENGFSVEMAIPFRDLAFDPAKPDWVLEISRNIRRKGERLRWTSIAAATTFFDISNSGTLMGIEGVNTGLGLDVQLFGSARYRFDWQQPKREITSLRASGNAFYKITPLLTGTLTVNPDFSDAPLDLLQVNTTRFNLFQPETRNFFLQDVSTFEFGGRGYSSTFNYYYPQDNARPFFSRNIGLANGLPVSIVSGGKLSGEYGGFGVGALSVLTNGTGLTKHNQVLSVMRVTRPMGESKAGFIFTNGDPTGISKNSVAGVDYQFRNSDFFPGKILQSDYFYQRSFSDKRGDDDTFGWALTYPNEPWSLESHNKQVGTNFYPALGFVNRTGIRQYDGKWMYRRRDLGYRWVDLNTTWYVVTGLDNRIQSRENGILAGLSLRSTDEMYMRIVNSFEAVPATFKIAGRVPVLPGRYTWTNINPTFKTNEAFPISFKGDIQCCSFYNGDFFRFDLQTDWRVSTFLQILPKYTFTHVYLPTGRINIHQLSTDFRINFTPDMQVFAQIQFDNISQRLALSFRYSWEYEPGQELFASIGQSAVIPGEPTFQPQSTQATVRLGHTFRF